MNPQTQTLKFLVAAVVSVLLAWGTWYGTRPTPVEGFGKVEHAVHFHDAARVKGEMLVE